MVYISKVYTRSGDDGGTMLATGDRVGKDHPRIRSYGDLDELNAQLGVLRIALRREAAPAGAAAFVQTADEELGRIQQELFNLGAELATPCAAGETPKLAVHDRHVERLEREIDGHNAALPPLRSFVLPGGGAVAAQCHVARTVCRRAERELVALAHGELVRGEALRYVNRLSDYLFVLGRAAARAYELPEVLWDPASV
ncbi:MAG: cob(I)yrinic acid a,c-diamide adenosyltransferase [Nannocystaceae bacterium]|nr:cob(I)yrinic acid a,c-diamide adenosyltransferase [Nannocystaceae bacterium]